MYKEVKQDILKIMQSGVITYSKSLLSSTITIAIKKVGSPRICVNYRKLTKKDAKAIPRVDELLDALYGHKLFT